MTNPTQYQTAFDVLRVITLKPSTVAEICEMTGYSYTTVGKVLDAAHEAGLIYISGLAPFGDRALPRIFAAQGVPFSKVDQAPPVGQSLIGRRLARAR